MNNASNGPMMKATGLWAKSSVKGGQYLTGRLGGVKMLILENRDRQSDDDPSHHLFFVEAADRRQGAGERPQERSGAGSPTSPRTPQTASAAHCASFAGKRGPDHQAPLHRDAPSPARDVLDEVPEWAR